ncbi:MAG TPA: aldo/keto reductase [Bryobacteraceae bacterium]|jgi:aryl-alcohol dehydrogenase-like predicted oxidoreductase
MVSELSLGTVELGLEYGISTNGERLKPDESRAAQVLNEALELGINLLDTARAYGDAEDIIGRVLKGRRNEFFLLSKVAAGGNTRQAVEQSLTALQTSHADVMMIHCAADALPDEATAAELARLRDDGNIRFLGASVYGEEAALAAINSGWCDCIEIAYSVLDRRPEHRTLELARQKDIGILARSVLLKGALTRRILSLPAAFAPLQSGIDRLLQAGGISIEGLPELAYRYILMQQPPHSALVGSAHIEEVRACAGYARKGPLPEDTIAALRALELPESRWLNPGQWPPL